MYRFPCFSFVFLFLSFTCSSQKSGPIDLTVQSWIHGSQDCSTNTDSPIQVVQYDATTWILRQNKCLNYEAPFMFLFLGEDKALLMDTGATESALDFPLQKTIMDILKPWEEKQQKTIELVVAHTHGHGDHHAGDGQFSGLKNTKVLGLKVVDVQQFFKLDNWPEEVVDFDLGNRSIRIIPIPGHQEASIALYDPASKLLLTGDTFYPGRLYVNDWSAFKQSIARLVHFSDTHEIRYILGNHIEMTSDKGKDYPIGTTYQPKEQPLPLFKEDLQELHSALLKLGETPTKEVHDKFIIYPTK